MHNSNNPTSNPTGNTGDPLSQLVVKPDPGAAALTRSGIGEEVSPGVFVLEKRALLAALALKVFRDQQFIDDEALLLELKNNDAALSLPDLQLATKGLLSRIESGIELARSIAIIPTHVETQSNLLELTLPTLDVFSSYGKDFPLALQYVTQPHNILVPESTQWSRQVLFTCALQRSCSLNQETDAAFKQMADHFRLILKDGGDILKHFESMRLVPLNIETMTVAQFWGALFCHKNNCDNPDLLNYVRKFVAWPMEWDSVDNDATFLALFIGKVLSESGQVGGATTFLNKFSDLQVVAGSIAKMVFETANTAERRIARWN